MAVEGELEKQPNEKVGIVHVFANALDAGETLQTVNVTVKKMSDGTDVTSSILIANSTAMESDRISYGVQAGTHGEDYKATVTVTTSKALAVGTPTKLEVEHLIRVRER